MKKLIVLALVLMAGAAMAQVTQNVPVNLTVSAYEALVVDTTLLDFTLDGPTASVTNDIVVTTAEANYNYQLMFGWSGGTAPGTNVTWTVPSTVLFAANAPGAGNYGLTAAAQGYSTPVQETSGTMVVTLQAQP